MNYIETCTKIAVFLWRSSNYRPLTSVLHVRPGWIIYQNMRETWEKKVMKFEREIPIGLDARRKKWQGGAIKAPPPPPMGLGLKKNNSWHSATVFDGTPAGQTSLWILRLLFCDSEERIISEKLSNFYMLFVPKTINIFNFYLLILLILYLGIAIGQALISGKIL